MAKAQLLGAKELIAQFQKLDSETATTYVSEALLAGAQVIRDSMVRKMWIRTGRLVQQLGPIVVQEKSRERVLMTLSIGPDGFYWRFLEFGTHWRRGRLAGRIKLAPHPRLKQAFTNRRTTATQTIRDTFRDFMEGFTQ